MQILVENSSKENDVKVILMLKILEYLRAILRREGCKYD